ncbi:methyl-accepting chemotaxis protein, partial [Blautia producta]
ELGRLTGAIHTTKRELKKYISDIDANLAQMAKGNMNLEIGDDYRGEFLPIQRAMRTILEALNLALSEINEAADQVAAGSDQVATSAQVLASGSTQQASTVQTLSDSI